MGCRRIAPLVLAAVALVAVPSAAFARYEGNFNVFLGQKWMKTSDWDPVAEQPELGLMLAFGIERAPIYLALDVLASQKTSTANTPTYGPVDVKALSREYGIGVRKVWTVGSTHPFLGAGGCVVAVDLDLESATYSPSYGDQSYGLWIDGGVTWRIGKHFNLGFDLRATKANAKFEVQGLPVDVAAGGFHAGLLVGYGW